jgi:hypothetical protein
MNNEKSGKERPNPIALLQTALYSDVWVLGEKG